MKKKELFISFVVLFYIGLFFAGLYVLLSGGKKEGVKEGVEVDVLMPQAKQINKEVAENIINFHKSMMKADYNTACNYLSKKFKYNEFQIIKDACYSGKFISQYPIFVDELELKKDNLIFVTACFLTCMDGGWMPYSILVEIDTKKILAYCTPDFVDEQCFEINIKCN